MSPTRTPHPPAPRGERWRLGWALVPEAHRPGPIQEVAGPEDWMAGGVLRPPTAPPRERSRAIRAPRHTPLPALWLNESTVRPGDPFLTGLQMMG